MAKVPIVPLSQMSAAERRAYVLADNKLGLDAGWDRESLAIELQGLVDVDFDCEDRPGPIDRNVVHDHREAGPSVSIISGHSRRREPSVP